MVWPERIHRPYRVWSNTSQYSLTPTCAWPDFVYPPVLQEYNRDQDNPLGLDYPYKVHSLQKTLQYPHQLIYTVKTRPHLSELLKLLLLVSLLRSLQEQEKILKNTNRTQLVKSAVQEHVHRSKNYHKIDWENVKVLEKETREFPRKVLEAIHIRRKRAKFDRDTGIKLDTVWENL